MSNEGDRAAVFRTTKVRTKLKGDGSWLQHRKEPQAETQEEKPWLAEVRASRLNGSPSDNSPVSSPTKPNLLQTKPDTERAPTSGYMIRGIFTKLDDKPATSSKSNGISGATQFNKKPSENYKRIAPHTVRPTPDNPEGQLSHEEQEKRTEAASSVLKKSSVRERSYVFSAAKKYESKEKSPDTSLVSTSPSFVAKRVEIIDDDESTTIPTPASSPPPSPVVPGTSVAAAPEPKPRKIVQTAVDTPVDKPVEETAPEPVEEDPTVVFVIKKDPFEDMKPGCTKVATPLPELIPVCVEAVWTEPDLEESDADGQADDPMVKLTPALSTPVSTTPASSAPQSPSPASPAPESPAPESPAPVSDVTEMTLKTELKPEPEPEEVPESEPEPEPEPESKPSPKPSSSVGALTALYDSLICFDTNSTSFMDNEPELAEEEGGSVDSHTTENGVEKEPAPALSNSGPITDNLLGLNDGPEESAQPVPPSPGRWSQDLLTGLDSEAEPAKTSGALDLLANDAILINTEASSLSEQREEEKQTDETSEETQSPTERVTITTKTMIITDKSSADPFDPYPIGTASLNSSSDLLQPLADISINSTSCNAVESLADNSVPINTDTTRLSTRSWAHTWDTSMPQQANTEESQEPEPEGQAEDQQTLIMFERKSTENDSPWDRWTSPTVYTIATTTGEEEEEEEEGEEEEREIHSEQEPAMERERTVIEEDLPVQTPEPESKKGFVYVKEYVNATELSLYNARDKIDRGSDYLTSNSVSSSYSSPSSYSSGSPSSTCTYCGQQVGSEAKITIEHLNINCHPACFKCAVCSKPMGDLLYSMFLHGGKVHCESCYSKVLD